MGLDGSVNKGNLGGDEEKTVIRIYCLKKLSFQVLKNGMKLGLDVGWTWEELKGALRNEYYQKHIVQSSRRINKNIVF